MRPAVEGPDHLAGGSSGGSGKQSAGLRKGRIILHIDMNAFYCSVHEAVEPDKYGGRPLAVAGSVELRKGIIVTSSYPARSKGVRTGMQVREALKLCPELILLQPDFQLYRSFSRKFMQLAYSYSPLVEAMSIDECFVDITGSGQFGEPLAVAQEIQRRIREELGLPCSVGVAPNKLLAKMASDMKKPNGLTVLRIRDVPRLLWPSPCASLYGIGRKTAAKLERLGIATIGQLADADEALLSRHFGVHGPLFKQHAHGIDHAEVNPEREQSKSIGHTTTLPADVSDSAEAHRVLLNLADQTGRRLRRQKLLAQTVQLVVRDAAMRTITRSRTMPVPSDDSREFHKVACRLFDEHWPPGKPARLLGISLQNLSLRELTPVQLDLFELESQPRKERLNQVVDRLRDKFGEQSVLTAGMLGDDPSALIRNHKARGTSLQTDHMHGDWLEGESRPGGHTGENPGKPHG